MATIFNDVYVSGTTHGNLPGNVHDGSVDAFLMKADGFGNAVFKQFGTNTYDAAQAIEVDQTGVYVVGHTIGAFDGQTNMGYYDCFVSKSNHDLSDEWVRQFGTSDYDTVLGVSSTGTDLYVCGQVSAALPGQVHLGSADAFVAKLGDAPGISVSPASIDFGQIDVWDTTTAIVSIGNAGNVPLSVTDISMVTGSSADITILSGPTPPFSIAPGTGVTVTIQYHPWETGSDVATLEITSNDPINGEVQVTISGSAIQPEEPAEDLVDDIGDFFDDASEDGDLEGTGGGNSGDERLADLLAKFDEAKALIEAGEIEDAIGTLKGILKKCDGKPKPPDHVTGEAAEELAARIQFLIDLMEEEL